MQKSDETGDAANEHQRFGLPCEQFCSCHSGLMADFRPLSTFSSTRCEVKSSLRFFRFLHRCFIKGQYYSSLFFVHRTMFNVQVYYHVVILLSNGTTRTDQFESNNMHQCAGAQVLVFRFVVVVFVMASHKNCFVSISNWTSRRKRTPTRRGWIKNRLLLHEYVQWQIDVWMASS